MQIHRYLNGKPITRKELSHLELQTDALKSAVLDARRRAEQGMNGVGAFGATEGQGLCSVMAEGQGLFSATAEGDDFPKQHEA